jgi:hypothetical protein
VGRADAGQRKERSGLYQLIQQWSQRVFDPDQPPAPTERLALISVDTLC